MELIENYGVSWAYLLMMDGEHPKGAVLQQRDQVSLKDKARNMKINFLKYVFLSTILDIRMLTPSRAGARLPNNFERIPLGNRLIGMLDVQGVVHNEH